VQQNRVSTESRIYAIEHRSGIYSTYSAPNLKIALNLARGQLADFPKHTC
jgi:hypothetical protein